MNPNDVNGIVSQAQDGQQRYSTTIDPNCLNGVGELISALPHAVCIAAEGTGAAVEVGGALLEVIGAILGGIFSG